MTPLVSVIIPTFNRLALCQRAIQSVCDQSYTNYECIVINDGSTDGTDKDSIVAHGNQGIIYHALPSNCGVAYARNFAVSQARGSWIAFLDSDDVWHPKKLERQIAWIKKNSTYSIVQTREIWIRKGRRVNPPKTHDKVGGWIFPESLKRCMITPSSVMIKKKLFLTVGGFNESLPACEDYDLWLRLTYRHPVGLVDDYLMTRYGGHEDQLSFSTPILDRYRIRALLNLLTHESISDDQRGMVLSTLKEKCTIVAQGFKKRNRIDLYERYHTLIEQCASSL